MTVKFQGLTIDTNFFVYSWSKVGLLWHGIKNPKTPANSLRFCILFRIVWNFPRKYYKSFSLNGCETVDGQSLCSKQIATRLETLMSWGTQFTPRTGKESKKNTEEHQGTSRKVEDIREILRNPNEPQGILGNLMELQRTLSKCHTVFKKGFTFISLGLAAMFASSCSSNWLGIGNGPSFLVQIPS